MELKPGFKRTELGLLPSEWHVRKLGDLVQGSRTIRYGVVQPGIYDPQGCLLLRSQDYSKGWVTLDRLFRVRATVAEQYRNAQLSTGDLVMTVVGAGIGQVEVAPARLDCAVLSRSTARIAVDAAQAAPGFVRAALTSPLGRKQILGRMKEGAQPVVSCRDVAEFNVPCPPLSEQRAIAGALGDVDALLGGLDRLIAKKRDLKQAAMQQLLTGQTRLPGFTGKWETKRMGEILERLANGAVYSPASREGVAITRIETIADGSIDYARTGLARWSSALAKYELRSGDILFSHINSIDHIGKVALFTGDRPVYHGMNLLLLRAGAGCDNEFLYCWLSSEPARRRMRTLAKQAVSQASINTAELRLVSLDLPSIPEQRAIATVLSDMDAELTRLEQRRDKTRLLKQGMMQELLTGRTRLV